MSNITDKEMKEMNIRKDKLLELMVIFCKTKEDPYDVASLLVRWCNKAQYLDYENICGFCNKNHLVGFCEIHDLASRKNVTRKFKSLPIQVQVIIIDMMIMNIESIYDPQYFFVERSHSNYDGNISNDFFDEHDCFECHANNRRHIMIS